MRHHICAASVSSQAIVDLCLQLEEGRYLLLKDPNKPVMRLYTLPADAFGADDEGLDSLTEEGGAE